MEYTIIVKKGKKEGVYIGQCEQIPGAMSQGNSIAELMENMKDAIELMLEDNTEDLKKTCLNKKKVVRKTLEIKNEKKRISETSNRGGVPDKRESKNHSIFVNTATGKTTAVPRHAEIDEYLVFDICKQLGIPKPKIN